MDFAGGTLDIWPIGLLHPGAKTVNVAIDLPVEVRLEPRASGYEVRQGSACAAAESIAELRTRPEASLVACALEALAAPPCAIEIASASPRGAGLGASSSIVVALLGALEVAREGVLRSTALDRARLGRDLEARLMGLPTGLQDHLPPQLGGALEIEHAPGGERVTQLVDVDLDALGDRLLVAYTGESHFSAGNNWRVLRRRFEGDPEVTGALDDIRDVASAIAQPLRAAQWPTVGRLLGAEWAARRRLAPEISTPVVERMLEAANALGAWGGKACGAGGGGSIAVLAPPERRAAIAAALVAVGATILAARPTARGLEIASP